MDFLDEITRYVESCSVDESLSAIVGGLVEKQRETRPKSGKYYYLTDLVNPRQTYCNAIHPGAILSRKLAGKLALGTKLHQQASYWMSSHPDYEGEESVLDGIWEGVCGVRGRIDFRLGESLVELKTKSSMPKTPGEVIERHVQDLEQLIFYSAIHPKNPTENYLVFMENRSPYPLSAFRVTSQDFPAIKDVMKRRIKSLNNAISSGDPKGLGRCRYFNSCRLPQKSDCEEETELSTTYLNRCVSLEHAPEFTEELEELRDNAKGKTGYSGYHMIAPRKYYLKRVLGREESFEGDRFDEEKALLSRALETFKKERCVGVGREKRKGLESGKKIKAISGKNAWMLLKSSSCPEGKVIPYLCKISRAKNATHAKYPSQYHLAELAVRCAAYGVERGILFIMYPNITGGVKAYQIAYGSKKKIAGILRMQIEKIAHAVKENNMTYLRPCPEFMCNASCPGAQECGLERKAQDPDRLKVQAT